MDTFIAADGLAIHIGQGEWQLAISRVDGLTLFNAVAGSAAVKYRPEFARIRRLPVEGELPIEHIREVVAGWSPGDRAWHLGMLLAPVVAEPRGGRWCLLARWQDESGQVKGEEVRQVGQQLAEIMGVAFRFVAPAASPVATATLAAQATPVLEKVSAAVGQPAQVAQAIALPLEVGEWRLRPIDIGLQWEHTAVWSVGTFARIIFRLALGIVFIALGVLTLQSPYAPVQPAFLPYLGLIVGVVLIVDVLRYILRLMRTEVVVVDRREREVRRHLDLTSDVLDVYDFDEIRAVVVTQIARNRQRGRDGQPDRVTHEAWLHLLLHEPHQEPGKERDLKPEDAYLTIGYIEQTEGEALEPALVDRKQERAPRLMRPEEATTPAQKAAVVLAQAIQVDAYLDQR
ncbi:MAG: hypothetical protein HPY64_12545 [Anaerolineae bacterium]|nr:hypothetical protein [Anaerolineae bacterium]